MIILCNIFPVTKIKFSLLFHVSEMAAEVLQRNWVKEGIG